MSDAPQKFTVICHEGSLDMITADTYCVDPGGYLHLLLAEKSVASYAPNAWKSVWDDEVRS